jgi:hypothetical protein
LRLTLAGAAVLASSLTGIFSAGQAVAATSAAGRALALSSAAVWLCEPGMGNDPCTFNSRATAVEAGGARATATLAGVQPTSAGTKFDCFYVYPTVSDQKTANANLTVQKAEIGAAIAQASQFSQVCTVWAPMYRQATSASVKIGLSRASGAESTLRSTFTVAYNSLLSAWNDFLAHDDHDRPIILIGHSQGSAILIHLIATQVDHDPAVLRRLVVAIIAGGNLQVPTGETVGATFAHVSLCTSSSQTGCAIAYSTYPSEPPPNSLFGRPGEGVSLQSGQTARRGQQVACVDPAALGGGTADLSPYFLSATQIGLEPPVSTPWVTYPDLYSATCESRGGASWLQVTDVARLGDTRPVVKETSGPTWGYHLDDINLCLGNLIRDVAGEEAAWVTAHG